MHRKKELAQALQYYFSSSYISPNFALTKGAKAQKAYKKKIM